MELSDREAIQLRAILALGKQGFDEADICRALKISRRTLYRRLAKGRILRRQNRPSAVLPAAVAC